MVQASDPDIVSDFPVPENSIPDADLFTFSGIRGVTPIPLNFFFLLILEVGFIDTTNRLFTQTLSIGDTFIANAGTISVPTSVLANGIDGMVLAKAFKTDVPTIQKIKTGLAAKA
ncbi:PREDICTED: germin-like protein 9-3 [Populus euphratica]|uniref:Germin-like protein 9-3 n=1 Tax=Populus euphratica TaxID=75702 RepID=A0AAJ6XBF8_POPEU|nr:PREDICTED: germin-like protein 9-3 [Populus euphratica]